MEMLTILGITIVGMIALKFSKEKEIMRISWDKVAQFTAFLVLLSIARIALFSYLQDSGSMEQFPQMPEEISSARWRLLLVFWEDFFFGVPLYFIHKYGNGRFTKHLKWPATIFISMLFGLGHAYQGMFTMAVTSVLPYFVCRHYGAKYGFGTTMICHIFYDNFTFYTIWLLPYLL